MRWRVNARGKSTQEIIMKSRRFLYIGAMSLLLMAVGAFFISTPKRSKEITHSEQSRTEVATNSNVTLTATADVTMEK